MKREELEEFHYITPIENLPTIFALGILSHNGMKKKNIRHRSVAMQEIQDRRAKVVVPGGKPLHDYVNLYFHARNPMMYLRSAEHASLCVLRVSVNVLDLSGVVVTDKNASSDYVRFAPAPGGLTIVDYGLTFAESWTHPDDPIEEARHKSAKCAEVLVPHRVDQSFILGIYVSCLESHASAVALLGKLATPPQVIINGHLFFRGG